jgi:FkbM family methyltransferase
MGKNAKHKLDIVDDIADRQVVFYGAGKHGTGAVLANIHIINIVAFCDANKTGDFTVEVGGVKKVLPIVSPERLKEMYPDAYVVISVRNPQFYSQIEDNLKILGVDANLILDYDKFKRSYLITARKDYLIKNVDVFRQNNLNGYEWAYNFFTDNVSKDIVLHIAAYRLGEIHLLPCCSSENQYFDNTVDGLLPFRDDEVFIDGGFFIGDTAEIFLRLVKDVKKIYGFEISQKNVGRAIESIKSNEKVVIVPKGLWSTNTSLRGNTTIFSSSHLSIAGGDMVDVIALDDFFADQSVDEYPTIIKMDIEGAEKEALLGAKRIIKTVKPKLCICAYHKPEDIYELPKTILALNPEYKLYLRHYTDVLNETVLYAI